MNTALAVEITDRLAKLLRLIFNSDKQGEIVAAVAAAKRVLETSNHDAHFVADAFERGAAPLARANDHDCDPDDVGQDADRSDVWFAWHRRHRLSPKECAFIENIVRWSAPLSPRQKQWLSDIVNRLEAA